MTILNAKQKLHEYWMQLTEDGKNEELAQALSIAEIVLLNYDISLKNDMIAMLTDIQLEIEEIDESGNTSKDIINKVSKIIQQKIDVLKNK
jgi:hypothetical protein